GLGRSGELGPGVAAVAVQVQGATGDHDASVTHTHQLLTLDVVSERDGGVVGVGLGFGTDFQFAVHHDPLSVQRQVGFIGEAQLAVDGETVECRRVDVEDNGLARRDLDQITCCRDLVVRPGGRIGPACFLCLYCRAYGSAQASGDEQ